jgi:ankyrin repeat protein
MAAVRADFCICLGDQAWHIAFCTGEFGKCTPDFTVEGASLHYALARGDLAAAKQAISVNGTDVNAAVEGWTPLHVALMTTWGGSDRGNAYSDGAYQIISYLLEKGANPNVPFPTHSTVEREATPLSWVAYDGRIALVAKMIQAGGNVKFILDDSKRTPLHEAAICNPIGR